MATSAFKSRTKRAPVGGSSSGDSASRSLRRSRSLSRFSRPITAEADTHYNNDAPWGKFVTTTRGSAAPFSEISLNDLALDFFSSSSKNESDGGVERSQREGRSLSRSGEIGRWASDTASSRRRGRSVSRGRGDVASATPKHGVPFDAGSRRRRSVSVARSHGIGNAVGGGDKVAVEFDSGSRRRRSLSVARPRCQISDSRSDIYRSQNSSNHATVKAPIGGNTHLPLASKVAASSSNHHRLGRSRSRVDHSLIQDGYSSHSSALTDDESKDTHFGKNGFEKIIRAVHAQKKAEHPSEDIANGGLYEAMRKELRHAVQEIRTELNQTMGRNLTDLASDVCLQSDNSKSHQDSYRIRQKYAQKLEQLEKCKKDLLTEMLLEDQCNREVSRASVRAENPPQVRKRSSDRNRMSDILIEDAERYFEDFMSNIEDTDLSSFDGERSDASSTLGGMVKGRDFATEAETCKIPAGPTSRPVQMDGVILPWLQWETSHDGSLMRKTKAETPATPITLQMDSEKDTSPLHDPSSYSMSSHGSWSPGVFNGSPMDKQDEACPTKTGMSSFDMDEYRKLKNCDEILFEMYRERNRIGLGGLLLCTGVLH